MVIKTASPGIIVNEVDLTKGTSDAITTNVACLCGPFQKGPVDELYKVDTEAELVKIFGEPTDENYEYWWTVSNYLEYGGVCYVVRVDDSIGDAQDVISSDALGVQKMRNAADILTEEGTGPYVKNDDDFYENTFGQGESEAHFIARNPGDWGNALSVAVIDQGADYKMRLDSENIRPNTRDLYPYEKATGPDIDNPDRPYPLIGFEFDSTVLGGTPIGTYYRFEMTGEIGVDLSDDDTKYPVFVKFYERDGSLDGAGYIMAPVDGQPRSVYRVMMTYGNLQVSDQCSANEGATKSNDITKVYETGRQRLYKLEGYPFNLLTEEGDDIRTNNRDKPSQDNLDLLAELSIADPANPDEDPMVIDSVWLPKQYTKQEGAEWGWGSNPRPNQKVSPAVRRAQGPVRLGETFIYNERNELWTNIYKVSAGDLVTDGSHTYTIEIIDEWYSYQVAFSGIYWSRFGPRPLTTFNAQERGTKNDGINIILYDKTGDLTGSRGNVLETWFGVSKLKGAMTPDGSNNYYIDRINRDSFYIFANQPVAPIPSKLNDNTINPGDNLQSDKNVAYVAPGSRDFKGGVDNLYATLGELIYGYNKFDREEVFDLDYILQGPSRNNDDDAIALANNLVAIAHERKDCMVFLSPPRHIALSLTDPYIVTDRMCENWAQGISSSSYTVLDSGYKMMYDRWRDNRDTYVPLNGDIAGTVVYTAFRAEPWYSPAGFSRGQIRNVTKLPYNPTKRQRDDLYTNRINPVVTFKGEGTVLFGDKTALAYSSAFDRINVRRLFLVIEKEIAKISRTTLFEFNDEITRTLFKNNVNPYLRDVQSRRGMYDFLVVCDETNNTPEVIDRNEFIADIYIKPAKSINFITLNFIATKTGVSFEESIALFRRNST